MKTKYLNLAITFIVIIAMSGCKKETTETVTSKNANDQILKYKSIEDFDKSVSTVLKMTPEERKLWAKEKSFVSFGVKCDEIYSNSHPENFTTIEQFKKLVENNSAFLLLEKQENGEFSLETVISKSPFRYFANLERMYQIDDKIYKVLEEGIISTNSKNIEKLKLVNEQNYALKYVKDPDLVFSNFLNGQELSTQTKSTMIIGCGNNIDDYQSSGNDRTHLWIDTYPQNYTDNNGDACSRNIFHYKVRPYKRTLGVWYYCTRTVTFCITSASAGRSVGSMLNIKYDYFSLPQVTQSTQLLENTIEGTGSLGSYYSNGTYGFSYYNCWADTPSSPTVNLNCY
ncbi:MAG: hypothetical protein ACOYMD_13540 [Paludibacter sp.]